MAIFGHKRSLMDRVRQQAAPVATTPLSRQRADVRAMAASTPKDSPVAPNSATQAAAVNQFNQSQQGAIQRFNAANKATSATPRQNIDSWKAAKVAATKQAAPRTLAPTGASMGVPGMDFRMSKGGMTKKTGYAKGGAVMCGASMPPAQKRKK